MIYLLAVLDFWDYFVVWIIVMIFGGAYAAKSSGDSRQLKRIESSIHSSPNMASTRKNSSPTNFRMKPKPRLIGVRNSPPSNNIAKKPD